MSAPPVPRLVALTGRLGACSSVLVACLSVGCAVHCLATPLLLTALPALGVGFLAHDTAELALVLLALALNAASLCWGFRAHRQHRVWLAWLGAALLTGLAVTGEESPHETALMLASAGLLLTGHFVNRRLCQTCRRCEHGVPHTHGG